MFYSTISGLSFYTGYTSTLETVNYVNSVGFFFKSGDNSCLTFNFEADSTFLNYGASFTFDGKFYSAPLTDKSGSYSIVSEITTAHQQLANQYEQD